MEERRGPRRGPALGRRASGVGGPLGGAAPSTSENWGASPATSDSNQHAASFPPFELVAGDVQFEFGEVVSALVGVPGEFPDDFDISSFFA